MPSLGAIWVYLAASPLLWLTVTLAAYLIGQRVAALGNNHPVLNPVAVAVCLLVGILALTGTPYRTYFDGAQFVSFLLGPATVALAVPLFDNIEKVRRSLLPMTVALIAGSAAGILSAAGLARLMGASREMMATVAPKSVTSAIAMGVSEQLGGIPSLTAALVLATGIAGAIIALPLLKLLRIGDPVAGGFAVGIGAHGIGTARAFQIDEVMGTFSGVAMALNGLTTAILAPLLLAPFW